ncbi:hypothetical protein BTH22_00610 [Acinetobacter baumannii]|nr:hypothetical protein BTH22_00610 [Acinetobacter baumannii]OTM91791.1 hypothetical protein B9X65_11060 [Acinetobacter baumannii]
MQLERFIDREPKQFAYFHRLMGYSILSLILVIYAFTSPNTNYQIYIPPFFLFLLFVSSKRLCCTNLSLKAYSTI